MKILKIPYHELVDLSIEQVKAKLEAAGFDLNKPLMQSQEFPDGEAVYKQEDK